MPTMLHVTAALMCLYQNAKEVYSRIVANAFEVTDGAIAKGQGVSCEYTTDAISTALTAASPPARCVHYHNLVNRRRRILVVATLMFAFC